MENDKEKFKNDFKKRLYAWVLQVLAFVNKLPKTTINDVLIKQLIRSGTSVLANYIEANSASSKKDFTNFFTHSLKSANESKVWLALLRDTNQGTVKELALLLTELNEIANILATSILTLKNKR
jgi:four helix bundle protein